MKTLEVTAAIIRQTGEQCIIRECQEELGVTLSVERELTDIKYEYPDRIVHMRGSQLTKVHNTGFAQLTKKCD